MVLPSGEQQTVETAIKHAADAFERSGLFFGHGTETAIDEASWLVLAALNLSPAEAPDYQRVITEAERQQCNLLLQRRIDERKPAAYLTGSAWFAGHRFVSDERALVPRSPLAEFITEDFFGFLAANPAPRILDLCTGGGCIAIACAHAMPSAEVHASDLSPEALSLARENITLHHMEERISLLEGSLFEPVRGTYSLIISNPPYVDAADIKSMPTEFLHEPIMGLAAGDDGLDLVRPIIAQAGQYLEADGLLIVEVGNSAAALEKAYPTINFAWLEFAGGGEGVFLLTRNDLLTANF